MDSPQIPSNVSRPRVLMITGRADFGGGPEHMYRLAEELRSEADIFIATPREEPYWQRYKSLAQNRLIEIPHRRFSLAGLVHLCRFVRRHGIGIVHAHGR